MSLYGTFVMFLIWDHMGPQGSARLAAAILSILAFIVGL